jgi:hypothetical protein
MVVQKGQNPPQLVFIQSQRRHVNVAPEKALPLDAGLVYGIDLGNRNTVTDHAFAFKKMDIVRRYRRGRTHKKQQNKNLKPFFHADPIIVTYS